MANSESKSNAPWLTAMAEHEGFPLALRVRPQADSAANKEKFRRIGAVTHELAQVKENGLPDAEYNDSLAEFDHDVHQVIERDRDALIVIVETFAGKRNYYAYVADKARFQARAEELRAKYPQHELTIGGGDDPKWELYADYRERFPW